MSTQIINISLPKNLLNVADEQAKKELRSRSELFREALRAYLKDQLEWEELFTYGRKRAKELGIKPKDVRWLIEEYQAGK